MGRPRESGGEPMPVARRERLARQPGLDPPEACGAVLYCWSRGTDAKGPREQPFLRSFHTFDSPVHLRIGPLVTAGKKLIPVAALPQRQVAWQRPGGISCDGCSTGACGVLRRGNNSHPRGSWFTSGGKKREIPKIHHAGRLVSSKVVDGGFYRGPAAWSASCCNSRPDCGCPAGDGKTGVEMLWDQGGGGLKF